MSAMDIKKNPQVKEVEKKQKEGPKPLTQKDKRRFSRIRRMIKNQNSKK